MLEFIILGFLLHGDMTGYDIKQFMQISIANFYDASFGSIYPAVKKMEEGALVTCTEVVDGGKYRKVYAITPKGHAVFLQWLDEPIALKHDMNSPLVKIFFYDRLPKARAQELIGRLIVDLQAELEALTKLEGEIPGHANCFETATLDYGKRFYSFAIDWCETLSARIAGFDEISFKKEREE